MRIFNLACCRLSMVTKMPCVESKREGCGADGLMGVILFMNNNSTLASQVRSTCRAARPLLGLVLGQDFKSWGVGISRCSILPQGRCFCRDTNRSPTAGAGSARQKLHKRVPSRAWAMFSAGPGMLDSTAQGDRAKRLARYLVFLSGDHSMWEL